MSSSLTRSVLDNSRPSPAHTDFRVEFEELIRNPPNGGRSPEQVELVRGVLRRVRPLDNSFDPTIRRSLKRQFDLDAEEEEAGRVTATASPSVKKVILQRDSGLSTSVTSFDATRAERAHVYRAAIDAANRAPQSLPLTTTNLERMTLRQQIIDLHRIQRQNPDVESDEEEVYVSLRHYNSPTPSESAEDVSDVAENESDADLSGNESSDDEIVVSLRQLPDTFFQNMRV